MATHCDGNTRLIMTTMYGFAVLIKSNDFSAYSRILKIHNKSIAMEIAIIKSDDKDSLALLTQLAHKLGMGFKVLSEEEKEDIGMAMLMQEADRNEKVSEEEIMGKLG